jgi:hypothetical protein
MLDHEKGYMIQQKKRSQNLATIQAAARGGNAAAMTPILSEPVVSLQQLRARQLAIGEPGPSTFRGECVLTEGKLVFSRYG